MTESSLRLGDGMNDALGVEVSVQDGPATLGGSYCLLVSSCDSYADCWHPFFTLLSRYWQPPVPPIYLNTETQSFAFPGLTIRCPRVELSSGRRLPWGERLLRTLDQIPYEIVLYLQEDYFINDTVDVAMIDDLVNLMQSDEISHVSLMHIRRPGVTTDRPYVSRMGQRAEYRISAQAGLWRKAALQSYLRRHESVWEFEWYGTRRARRKRDSFFYVNQDYDRAHGKQVVPYRATGVVHGLWARKIVEDLFAAHGIEVDFAARGFYDPENDTWKQKPRLLRAVRRLRSIV